jgi:hypothetical protein
MPSWIGTRLLRKRSSRVDGPPSFILDFAVVQAAVHDAVQAYDQRFEPYATEIQDASGSPVAAVAKATRDVLVNRFPAQDAAVHAFYVAYRPPMAWRKPTPECSWVNKLPQE